MSSRKKPATLLALTLFAIGLLAPAAAQADFGIKNASVTAEDVDGLPDFQAGSHPNYTVRVEMNQEETAEEAFLWTPEGTLRDLFAELPAGLVGNPLAVPRCPISKFVGQIPHCSPKTQIGVAHVRVAGVNESSSPVYNLEAPLGVAGEIGFSILELSGQQEASVRSEGDFGLTVSDITIPTSIEIQSIEETIWGVPADPSHDAERQPCLEEGGECPSDLPLKKPFLTLPTSCTGPLETTISVDSLENPGAFESRTVASAEEGAPVGLDGCNHEEFAPTISSKPTTNVADSPSGLDFTIHQPQNEDPEGLSTAHLKDVEVKLPQGVTLNPSAANGLGACSEEEIGLTSGSPIHFSANPERCPDAAKLGRLEVNSPLVDHRLAGSIYLAEPFENPFHNLTAIYLAIEDEQTGIVAKLAGKVTPDPVTGQLTASFTENPQLPLEDIETHFFNGPRGALKTPLACGTYITTAKLTPWSSPEGVEVTPSDSFATSVAAGGSGPCPTSEAQAPKALTFSAGTLNPEAASYSPFVLKLGRRDGSQQLTAIDTTLPPGLTGKLAGIPYCSEAQIAQAKSREVANGGAVEKASPSCPAASEVGTATIGAGAGITPFYVTGHAYLAGPYKGAPLSLVVVTPALAGPFDLGAVVVRTALYVNEVTAQIHAVSDPFPHIIEGVPLDLRSITLIMSRPDFTLNPSSCDPMAVLGSAATLPGQTTALTSPFQVGGCQGLAFRPKLRISLKGGTRRAQHPALRAVVAYPKGSPANIASAQVGLPHSEFLDQGNIGTVCTQPQLRSNTCPTASIYGHAKAWTPLLDRPLEGPVYLGVGYGHKLPDLVADLDGQIRILLNGKVDTTKQHGLRNTFEAVPDAPVSKFVLEMSGGKRKGLLVNSENICRKPQRANVSFIAHNGKSYQARPLIATGCDAKTGGRKRSPKRH